jgi:hypothetical protein
VSEKTERLIVDADTKGYVAGLDAAAAADARVSASGARLAKQFTETGQRVTETASAWRRSLGAIDEVARAEYEHERRLRALSRALDDGRLAQDAFARAEAGLKREMASGLIGLEAFTAKMQGLRSSLESGALAQQEFARVSALIDDRYGSKALATGRQILAQQERQLDLMRAELRLAGELPEVRARELALLRARQDLAAKGVGADSAVGRQIMANAQEIEALRGQTLRGGQAIVTSLEQASGAAKLTRMQMLTLQYTANDVVASLASGMSPLTILLQQGGQVTQAWGGVGATFRAAAAALGPFGLAAAALAVVIGGTVAASESWRGELRAMTLAARAGGDGLGYTRDQLIDLGSATAAAANVSDAAGRQIVAGLARARLGGDALAAVSAQARDFAALSNQGIPQAADALGKLFADPAKGARELDAAYGLLTAAQLRQIQTLADQGRKTEAQIALSEALGKRIRGLADEDLGYIAKAWKLVADSASNAWDAIGRGLSEWGKPERFDAYLARLKEVAEAQRQIASLPARPEGDVVTGMARASVSNRPAAPGQALPGIGAADRADMDYREGLRAQAMTRVAASTEEQRRRTEALRQEELKWLDDTASGLDATTAQRKKLGDEMARVYALALSLEATDPAGAAKARAVYERLESRQSGTLDPAQEAARAAQRAQAMVGLTGAQRALRQAEFDTQDAIARGLTLDEADAIGKANRAKALAGVVDASVQTMRAVTQETAALLAQADALGISGAAALQAQVSGQARSAALAGQVTDERAYAKALLDRAAAENLLATVQKTRDLGVQAESAQRLAAAEKLGAVAVRDVTLALADEADARETLAKATDGTLTRLLDELEVRKRLRREASDADVSRRATQTLAGQSGDIESLRLELSLVGKLPAERARELELLRVKQQLLRDGIDLNSEEGRKILENARLMGELRGQIEQNNREAEAQQKIWDNAIEGIQGSFSNFFENILSGGTNTWKDLAGSLKTVMIRTIAEIATAMVFKPVIGGVMNAVGLGSAAQSAGLGGGSSGGISGIFDKITGGIGNGTSAGGGITGGLNSWLFGSNAPVYDAATGLAAGYSAPTAGIIPGSSGGGLFGNSNLNIGTIGNVAGLAMSAFNFAQKPTIGSGLGLVGSGMGALSALGVLGPAFGPIGMGVSVVASLLGGLGNKVKHPGYGVEIMNDTEGLALGRVTGKHTDTSAANPMGQATIDAINGVVKNLTGGSVGAGTGRQVYGVSHDLFAGGFRVAGEGLDQGKLYKELPEAIADITVSALKNLPLSGVADNVATALKKSTATSLEEIKADLDFARGFADNMALLKSGLDPMKSQAAEIASNAKNAAAGLQAWGTQFREKAVGLGQGTADEVNAALRSMAEGALGLTKVAEPLSGYALAWEQARANIAAFKDALVEFGFTAAEAGAKIAAATEAARQKLVSDQNSGLSSEILKLKNPRAADLADLEKWKAAAIAEAKAIGNQQGIALIEELFGLKQQAIVEQYANRIEGLTAAQQKAVQVLTDLTSRALAVRQLDRQKTLFDFDQQAAAQIAAAPAGTEGALTRVLSGERAMVEFQAYQRDLLEAYDRQIRGVQDQKSAVDAQISAIKAQTQALDGLRNSLLQFQQDLKLDPNLSTLSTGQRRGEAMTRMDALYAKGMAGDMDALREWEPLARQFLAISRDYNASTPGYVNDYTKVQGQLDGALGKIKSPLQIAEAQLATLEAQSKQFDQQIDLLQQQRDQAARLGERQLDSIESLKVGTMESLARLQAAQADLATGFGSLAAAIAGQRAAAAANSNKPAVGSDGRPVGLLGGGLDVVGQDNTTYSEWTDEKKAAWARLANNVGFSQDIYYRTGQDFMNSGGASRADGGGFNFVGASGQIYSGYDEWKSTVANSNRVFAEFLQNNNLTMDEALRQAAAGKFDAVNFLNNEKSSYMQRGGVVGGYAAGGIVGGNAIWNRDSVIARYAGGGDIALAGGEYVVTAPAVNSNTRPMLDAINRGGRVPAVPLPSAYRAAPASAPVDTAPIVAAVDRLGEKIDTLVDIVAASGDQSHEALQGVRSAMAAVALATKQQKLAS